MNGKSETTIEILGKFYQIKCPADELAALKEAASWLNEKMRGFRASSGVAQPEIVAIMTALNIACDYLQLQTEKNNEIERINQRLQQLDLQMNKTLQSENQLELNTEYTKSFP